MLGFLLVFLLVSTTTAADVEDDPLGTCWDPERSFLMPVKPPNLHASAEVIMAQIRQQTAAADVFTTSSKYASTEEIKAHIRREALLHVAEAMGVPPHAEDMETTTEEILTKDSSTIKSDSIIPNDSTKPDIPIPNDSSSSERSSDASSMPEIPHQNVFENTTVNDLFPNVTDERTMLDIFGERAKEFLTRKVVRQPFSYETVDD